MRFEEIIPRQHDSHREYESEEAFWDFFCKGDISHSAARFQR